MPRARPDLLDAIYGTNIHVSDRTMHSHLCNLRAKMDAAGCPDAVEAMHDIGVSDGNRHRIFEPFFTTRSEAGGTGMGLSIVHRIPETHGTEIELLPDTGSGARFAVLF